MYARGDGIERDYVAAYMWLKLSHSGGVDEAEEWLGWVVKRMSDEERNEAEKLVEAWEPDSSDRAAEN